MAKPIDKISGAIEGALMMLGEELNAKGGEPEAITNVPNRIERSVAHWRGTRKQQEYAASAPNPIEQCISLCDRAIEPVPEAEPIRTIHHLSCTGGTLIAKCVAAMPNVLLLNEVDPLSTLPFKGDKVPFRPTDMVSLLRQGDSHVSHDLLVRMFTHDIGFICDEQMKIGRSLVLRDHSHSHFLIGNEIPERPTLRDMLTELYQVRSILTVRDPVDSYLSMLKQGWHRHFLPSSFEEYCRRYLIFLEKHKDIDSAIIRYEDFVAEPQLTMQRICKLLELDYSDRFDELFGVFQFSGDSGRASDTIEARPRRQMDQELEQIKGAGSYRELVERLGYRANT